MQSAQRIDVTAKILNKLDSEHKNITSSPKKVELKEALTKLKTTVKTSDGHQLTLYFNAGDFYVTAVDRFGLPVGNKKSVKEKQIRNFVIPNVDLGIHEYLTGKNVDPATKDEIVFQMVQYHFIKLEAMRSQIGIELKFNEKGEPFIYCGGGLVGGFWGRVFGVAGGVVLAGSGVALIIVTGGAVALGVIGGCALIGAGVSSAIYSITSKDKDYNLRGYAKKALMGAAVGAVVGGAFLTIESLIPIISEAIKKITSKREPEVKDVDQNEKDRLRKQLLNEIEQMKKQMNDHEFVLCTLEKNIKNKDLTLKQLKEANQEFEKYKQKRKQIELEDKNKVKSENEIKKAEEKKSTVTSGDTFSKNDFFYPKLFGKDKNKKSQTEKKREKHKQAMKYKEIWEDFHKLLSNEMIMKHNPALINEIRAHLAYHKYSKNKLEHNNAAKVLNYDQFKIKKLAHAEAKPLSHEDLSRLK